MIRRMSLRFGILVALGTLCLTYRAFSQSQGCVDTASASQAPVQETKITIVSVEFQGENPLSDTQREELIKHVRQQGLWTTPGEPDSSWVVEALIPVRDALQEQGYFKADVEGIPYLALAQVNQRRYVLVITVEAGPQYRLGHVRFASATDSTLVFSEAILRQQLQLQEGDMFDVTKIRQGLESISRLYGSKGYIDATPETDTTIDEKNLRMDLLIRVDEQKPYRIAKIELLGLRTKAQNELTPPQQIGDFFNPALWRTFFKDNMNRLPPDSSPERNMPVLRDIAYGTVDIMLNFRPCPEINSSTESLRKPLIKRLDH